MCFLLCCRYEDRATFLEGTGCLVLDRQNKVAYAALSERCHLSLAEQWAEQMGYDRLVPYRSLDAQNHPVYVPISALPCHSPSVNGRTETSREGKGIHGWMIVHR